MKAHTSQDSMFSGPRIWVTSRLSAEGEPIQAPADLSHYLTRVLRLKDGATVRLFNGEDGEWLAELKSKKGDCRLYLRQRILTQPPPPPSLALAIPPLRKHRMEWLVEKATELGLTALYPLQTRHTAHHLPPQERILRRMAEAAEQSERMTVPELNAALTLDDLLAKAALPDPPFRQIIACVERLPLEDESSLSRVICGHLQKSPSPFIASEHICVLIGPEGGFHQDELSQLRAAPHVTLVSLGLQILRSETAALLALGLIQTSRAC